MLRRSRRCHFAGIWAALTKKKPVQGIEEEIVTTHQGDQTVASNSSASEGAQQTTSTFQQHQQQPISNESEKGKSSSFKSAILAGRKSARSPLFETSASPNVVAVEMKHEMKPDQLEGESESPHSNSPNPFAAFQAANQRKKSISSSSFTFPAKKMQLPFKSVSSSQDRRPAASASAHHEGSAVQRIVLEKNAEGSFEMQTVDGPHTSSSMRGHLEAYTPPREVALTADGQPALTRSELLAKRSLTSKQEIKDAIAAIVPPTSPRSKRGSSVRYKADVRQGQYRYTMELMKVIKAKKDPRLTLEEAIHQQCDFLNARERLDLLRMTSKMNGSVRRHKKINKRPSTPSKSLPSYYSVDFNRFFYFKESDIREKSAKGHGPGGQAANKRMQTIHIHHLPTGMGIRYSHFPSLYANRKAARILLSLRLEQQLMGDDSKLGRLALAKKKVLAEKAKRRKLLEKAGDKMSRMEKHRHPFLGFLQGMFSMVPAVVPKCEELKTNQTATAEEAGKTMPAKVAANKHITVHYLLDSTSQNRWWNILSESFYNHWCRPPTVRTFVRSSVTSGPLMSRMIPKRKICGWTIGANRTVPGWFCYFFPVVCRKPRELEKPSAEIMRLAHMTIKAHQHARKNPIPAGGQHAVPLNSSFVAPIAHALAETVAPPAASTPAPAASVEAEAQQVVASSSPAASSGDAPPTTATASPNVSASSASAASGAAESPAASSSTPAEELVEALLTQEAAAEALLAKQQEEAKAIFFDYLKQKKRYDIVARTIQYHEDQLAQLKSMPEGRLNVMRAVSAVVEVFGLFVENVDVGANRSAMVASTSPAMSPNTFRLQRDRANWAQYKHRLFTEDRQHVTPLAAAVFPHIIASLTRLGLVEEANGIKAFFSERTLRKQSAWAREMMDLITEALDKSD